jgi:hypothetical protein
MAEYQLTVDDSHVVRTADMATIPADPTNADYQAYQAWLAAGGVPDPYVPVSPSRRQEADAHLESGLTITGAGALDGTYHVHKGQIIGAILNCWNDSGSLPNGKSTVEIFDADNAVHNFDEGSFRTFASRSRDFVHNCNLYARGVATSLPPNSVSLATVASQTFLPFDHENRLRALEGLPPITFEEFQASL